MAARRARRSRRTSNTENGRRSSGSWPVAALTMTNWPGGGGSAIAGAPRVEDVVVGRQRVLAITSAATSTGIRESIVEPMRYLRMLTNSLVGGVLLGAVRDAAGAAAQPGRVPLDSGSVQPLLTWWIYYGIHATVFFYVLIVMRQLFAAS